MVTPVELNDVDEFEQFWRSHGARSAFITGKPGSVPALFFSIEGGRRYLAVFGDHDGQAGSRYLSRDSISPEGFPATVLWHDGKGGEQ